MMRVAQLLLAVTCVLAQDVPIDGNPTCKCLGLNTLEDAGIPTFPCDFDWTPSKNPSGKCVTVDSDYGNIAWWRTYRATQGGQCEVQPEPAWEECHNKSSQPQDGSQMPRPLFTPKSWCVDPWCYVDACKCNAPDTSDSSAFQSHGVPLRYSYSACGSIDGWTAAETDKKVG